MVLSYRTIIFTGIFIVLGLASLEVPIRPLLAAKGQAFTLFEFVGPTAGWFLGPWFGAASVIAVKGVDLVVRDQPLTTVNIIRLFPLAFAAIYLGSRGRLIGIVPSAAIITFLAHPVGREVWFYSLYWLIPLVLMRFTKQLPLKSLGATFTAHAVGGAAFIWAVPLPAKFWVNLIPIVAVERLVFALGIYATVLALNGLLITLTAKLPKRIAKFLSDGLIITPGLKIIT